MTARFAFVVALAILAGCAAQPPPPAAEKPKTDPTKESGYAEAMEQLAALNREAEAFLKQGRSEEAAAAITRGQPFQARLLAAPQPTLAAMEAASDLDDLYARMLLANHREGWARLFYQKNVSRWKLWKPETPDTIRRLKLARDGLAECDRRLK